MDFMFKTSGVCASTISFELDGDIVKNVAFKGGCNGNLKAVSALVEGMPVDEVISKVSGITCGFKKTSCCDQFAQALTKAKEEA